MVDRSLSSELGDPALQDLFEKIVQIKKIPQNDLNLFVETNRCYSIEEVVQKELEHHLWAQVKRSEIESRYDSLSGLIRARPSLEEGFNGLSSLISTFDGLAEKIDQRLEGLETSHPESWTPTQEDKEKWSDYLNKMKESWNRLKRRIQESPQATLFSENEEERKRQYYTFGVQFAQAFESLALKEQENLALDEIEEFIETCFTGWEQGFINLG